MPFNAVGGSSGERIVYRDRPVPAYGYRPEPRYEEPQVAYPAYNGNRVIGNVVGAVAGGVVGNQFGRGNGRVAATAVGAVLGSLVGGQLADPY
ncbi:MAG: glycine zipper 2TM domain-containing protein [Dechloromonas sp.]|nr:glycine zipper 2TM domain-containing protein [Dechloromonas sp.]